MGSLRSAATRGAASMVARQIIAFGSSSVSGILLARLLTPSDFGAFAYIVFVQALARLVVDGGLTATLVRQQEEPALRDWRSVFSLQLLLSVALAAAVTVTGDFLPVFSHVPGFAVANTLTALSLVVAPMLSISFARLERALRFDRIGILTLVQPLAFSIAAPILAATGFGVIAFGAAILLSNILALAVARPFTGRIPTPMLRPVGLRVRVRFSLPFIGGGLISTVKDAVNPLLVGVVVGAAAVGYIRWGQQVAALCIYLVSAVGPMLFAIFARVQADPGRLGRAVTSALFWANAITAPLAVLLALFIVPLTTQIYGAKWLPAIPLFFLLALTNLISPTTTVLLALCNAVGRPAVPFIFACIWFAGTWLFTALLVATNGAMAYAIANALVQVFGLALIVVCRRFVHFRLSRAILLPWGLSAIAAIPAAVYALVLHGSDLLVIAISGLVTLGLLGVLMKVFVPGEFDDVAAMLRSRRGGGTVAGEVELAVPEPAGRPATTADRVEDPARSPFVEAP